MFGIGVMKASMASLAIENSAMKLKVISTLKEWHALGRD